LVTSTQDIMDSAIDAAINAGVRGITGLAGIHFEGPHINNTKAGIHDPALIRPLEQEDVDKYISLAHRVPFPIILTLAPELVNPKYISDLVRSGVIVSLGHSNASAEVAESAVTAGASLVTHLFNAMSGVSARASGLAAVALTNPKVRPGLIFDNFHVSKHAASLALTATAASQTLHLVSDCLSSACGGASEFNFCGQVVKVQEGVCVGPDGTLAGAAEGLLTGLQNAIKVLGLDITAAIPLVTARPAQALALRNTGRLTVGAPATAIFLTLDAGLDGVMFEGKILA
jgi:N-acetylglucosamine-6-phosphate deacetylase